MKDVEVLHMKTYLFTAVEFQQQLDEICEKKQLQTMLFLSLPILREVMCSETYADLVKHIPLLMPGEEDVLIMHDVEQYKAQHLLMTDSYLHILCRYLEESGHSLYLVGDDIEKLSFFLHYCKEQYKDLRIVGTFVGGEQMDDEALLNDINVTCPEVVLTAIQPQVQENWIIKNRDKLNGLVCIGANVLVEQLMQRVIGKQEQNNHMYLYNQWIAQKNKWLHERKRRYFKKDYELYMTQKQGS
ncbi:MAG: WecB/TagA/CpsF family glycosyltransferase [Lachnospiraceae bacterium]|nr:WecB/TagA/CpsF family glycosyltransferase [Lachnospiraceae bacterium]